MTPARLHARRPWPSWLAGLLLAASPVLAVDEPDAVNVAETEGRNRLRLEVTVGPGDLGRVIGRRGRTAQSIRTLVRAAAVKDGREVDVDFMD